MKECSKCREIKPLTEFYKQSKSKDGFSNICKSCKSIQDKEYRENNKEKVLKKKKEYYENNKETIAIKCKEWRTNNKELKAQRDKVYAQNNRDKRRKIGLAYYYRNLDKAKEYRENNKEYSRLYNKQYRETNKDLIRIRTKEKHTHRLNTDPVYKLKHNIRGLVSGSISRKGYSKTSRTHEILGCDWNTLKEHFESQFDDNMNWDNQGTYWDIDHIIPLSSAKTEEDIIRLNHYTNLQPLESYYNRYIKRDKLVL